MAIKHTGDFKQEVVRIALTSRLPRRRVESDLGVGFLTLNKCFSQYRQSDLNTAPSADLAKENERPRLEKRILKEELHILKKATSYSRAGAREVRIYQTVAAHLASGTVVQGHAGTSLGALMIRSFARS